jgi:hypothetical protein
MRSVNMAQNRVVWRGLPWPEDSPSPSTKEMLARLERNEALISWLQPIHCGAELDDQFPAIQIGSEFYTISLRMMKAVWRHVRLKKGFVNRELVPHVGPRLRIPTLLLSEKIRTQQRFNVSVRCRAVAFDYLTCRARSHAQLLLSLGRFGLCGRSCGPSIVRSAQGRQVAMAQNGAVLTEGGGQEERAAATKRMGRMTTIIPFGQTKTRRAIKRTMLAQEGDGRVTLRRAAVVTASRTCIGWCGTAS